MLHNFLCLDSIMSTGEVAKHAGFEPQEFFARLAEQKLEDRLPPVREALKAAP